MKWTRERKGVYRCEAGMVGGIGHMPGRKRGEWMFWVGVSSTAKDGQAHGQLYATFREAKAAVERKAAQQEAMATGEEVGV
jgi:hypothetical protein